MAIPGQGRVERRLAAILAADVAGYSRLTGLGEEGTHALAVRLVKAGALRRHSQRRRRLQPRQTGCRQR
jgi:adenylate cyclase